MAARTRVCAFLRNETMKNEFQKCGEGGKGEREKGGRRRKEREGWERGRGKGEEGLDALERNPV